MAVIPKGKADSHFPGMGEQYVIGMANLGYCSVDATIAVNTSRTDAQVIASAPNTGAGAAFGPIVHSLGEPPTFVYPMLKGSPVGLGYGIGFQLITADNSAVYIRAASWTGTAPAGVGIRLLAAP